MKRRRIRRYRRARGNSGMKFLGFIGIMLAAVICGYLTARFIIAPILGYDTEVLKLDIPSKLTSLLEQEDGEDTGGEESGEEETGKQTGGSGAEESTEKQEKTSAEDESGYALQFGVFSERERAEELVVQLKQDGIEARVRKSEGKYKVISDVLATKSKAVEKLKGTETDAVSGIFITVI